MRGQDEEEVAEDAARHQPQQIENGGGRSELAEQIVEHGQRDDNKQPDAQQKNRKDERHLERRKEGKKVDIKKYLTDNTKKYDNKVTDIGNTLSDMINNGISGGLEKTFKVVEKLIE